MKIKLETTWFEFDDTFAADEYGFRAFGENDEVLYQSDYNWTIPESAKFAALHWAEENEHNVLNENDIRIYGVCIALENEKSLTTV